MKKLEQVNTYLNKFDETILKLLKESNIDSSKQTLAKTSCKTEDQTKQDESLRNYEYTPVSIMENSQLKKSDIVENNSQFRVFRSRQQIKTQTFEKFPKHPSSTVNSPNNQTSISNTNSNCSINILERLKIIEAHYSNKIKILEDDNSNLRKVSQKDKIQIDSLEQQVLKLDNELKQQQKLFQEILQKQLSDQKQSMQFELEEQETRLKRQFERQIARKDQRIQELEQQQQKKKSQHSESTSYHQLFTFKTQDH